MLRELQNFGLSEKEAKVYLALLELQKSTVQTLAAKAGVNRATTYVQLESLKSRGLVSHVTLGKKTLYVAEPPDNVSRLIEKEKVDVLFKEKEFKKVLPDLKELYKEIKNRPNVRFYEGKDGLSAYRAELFAEPHRTISAIIGKYPQWRQPTFEDFKKDVQNSYTNYESVRVLYVGDERNPMFDMVHSMVSHVQARFVPFSLFPIQDVEIDIFDKKKFIIGTVDEIPRGLAIDDEVLCSAFQAMFEMIWTSAKK